MFKNTGVKTEIRNYGLRISVYLKKVTSAEFIENGSTTHNMCRKKKNQLNEIKIANVA